MRLSARLSRCLAPLFLVAGVLLGHACGEGGVKLESAGDTLRFSTEDAVAIISTKAFRLSLLTTEGQSLAEEEGNGLRFQRREGEAAVESVRDFKRSDRTLRLAVETPDGPGALSLTWTTDRTLKVEFTPPNPETVTGFSEAYRLAPGEAIYGLSERVAPPQEEAAPNIPPASEFDPKEVGSLDRRGDLVEMYVRPTTAIYAPFYQSSAGYGLYVEGTTPGEFDVGASAPDTLRFRFETGTTPESHVFTYYLFVGPDHRTILDEYTALTGRPFIPPEWAFRHWRWRDELAPGPPARVDGVEINAQVVEDLLRFEEYGIPAGVYMIDRPWSAGSSGFTKFTDGEGPFGFNTFEWDEERLPNPEEMLDLLRERGYNVILWTAAWAVGREPGENGAEALQRGYLAPGSDRIIDLTNAAAWDWWRQKHIDFARRWDIAGWKLDRGEEFIPSEPTDIWADGRTGRELHNAYPNLQLQLMYEAMREVRGDDFVIFARAGYAGAQRYGVFWGGDMAGSTFFGSGPGTDLGLRNSIISLQRVGFMGFPIWGSDTGGYYQFKDRDVFGRWLEFSAFTPIMEVGGTGAHAPWDMPSEPPVDDEMLQIYKRYAQLHHDLVSYTVKHARIAGESGLPIARALVFDFPDDPQVRDRWDEFMYGDDLLVAPVWRTGQRSREVYLPEGRWEDFWDREKVYQGPVTITVDAPLEVIPVFVRQGAEVPGRPE